MQRIRYGPWEGTMRSRTAFECPRTHMATNLTAGVPTTLEYMYQPRKGSFKRRKGSTQKFDTFGASVGLLPAKWSSKCRQFDEFGGDKTSDGVPSVVALLTKETIASGLDDGRFSNLYIRDQANSVNYTLGDEYGTATYPAAGTTQTYRYCAIANLSGDGGLSRGVTEFQRRLLLGDPRGFLRVQRWFYFPGGPHGVPIRTTLTATPGAALAQYSRPSNSGATGTSWGAVGAATMHAATDDTSTTVGDSDYARFAFGLTNGILTITMDNLTTLTDPGVNTGFHLRLALRASQSSNPSYLGIAMLSGPTNVFSSAAPGPNVKEFGNPDYAGAFGTADQGNVTTAFVEYDIALTDAECANVDFAQPLTLNIEMTTISVVGTFDIGRIEFSVGSASSVASNRAIPSGPLPPTHAGTIAKGNAIAGTGHPDQVYPDSDVSIGAWVTESGGTASLYSHIDETGTVTDPINNADYIKVTSNSTYICTLGDFNFTPENQALVEVSWRAQRAVSGMGIDLTVTLSDATTNYAAAERTLVSTFGGYSFALSADQIAAITAAGAWNNLRLKFATTGAASGNSVSVSNAFLRHTPVGQLQSGGWQGSDRFAYAMCYRFEDDSVWAFSVPRFANAILTSGFNIFTVDSTNPTTGYDKITWSNLPVPLYGVKEKGLLRSNKIDFTAEDSLAINLHDMRVVAWLDPSVTTYDDYAADDDALVEDPDKLWIHEDHIMPPRARWIFGGESRIGHSYGGVNPCAIELAPVGATVDYDRNVADDSATAYATPAMYFKVTSTALTLYKDSGTPVSLVLTFGTGTNQYNTLQDLCDRINATSCAVSSMQWRAQILPGQSPDAVCSTSLMPTYRSIASCVTATSTALTKAAGGLSAVPVGAFVTGTYVTAGTYVTKIVSDAELTLSAATTGSATNTMVFTANTGDAITVGTVYDGYVRARCNALPEFLYFNTTYLAQFPLEKSSIWLTSANPESYNSAPNCFRGDGAGKHKPPGDVGICMGGAALGQGFVTPYSKARKSRIANNRDSGTGLDKDYHLSAELDAGSIGPIAVGNGCVFVPGPEGWFAMDMQSDLLISGAIYQHPASDAVAGVGDFFYEAPLCIAAAAADTDTAYLCAKVMRGALWISYRASSASSTHPNRQVVYDFSDSNAGTGLAAMVRDRPVYDDAGRVAIPVGVLWGWSMPLSRSVTQLCEGRRSDGAHLYGWNEANAGSAGDGRIDEMEVTDQDNAVDISASWRTPWESGGTSDYISAQEIYSEHVTSTTATVTRTFTRSLTGDTYTGTPSKSDTLIVSADIWGLPITGARVASAACYCGGTQTAGPAQELRLVELRAKSIRNLSLGAAG